MAWDEESKTLMDREGDLVRVSQGGILVSYGHNDDGLVRTVEVDISEHREELARAIWPECPEPAPAPFKTDAAFEDVQVGDRVRVTYKDGDVLECTVGVAGYRIESESGVLAAAERDRDYTIDILSRPKPSLPTEAGSFVEADGELFVLRSLGIWIGVTTGNIKIPEDIENFGWKPATVTWSTK